MGSNINNISSSSMSLKIILLAVIFVCTSLALECYECEGDECTTAPGGNPDTETCDDDEDICFFKMANNKVQKRDCHKKSDVNTNGYVQVSDDRSGKMCKKERNGAELHCFCTKNLCIEINMPSHLVALCLSTSLLPWSLLLWPRLRFKDHLC